MFALFFFKRVLKEISQKKTETAPPFVTLGKAGVTVIRGRAGQLYLTVFVDLCVMDGAVWLRLLHAHASVYT